MKRLLPVLALCLLPGSGQAQVIVHQAALDQLAGIAPASQAALLPPAPEPEARRAVQRVARRRHVVGAPSTIAFQPPPPPGAAAPVARVQPPPGATPTAPTAHAVPAVLPPAVPKASLHFAAGSADLPAGAAAVLKPICAAAEPSGMVDVAAPAPASPGDASIGMRLSMQRAFAVRDALTACGISPARIVPRAVGTAGGGDPDTARISLGSAQKP